LTIVEALSRLRLRSRSCIIDGEAACCGDDGVPSFDRIRYRRHDASVSRSRVRPHRAPVQAEAGSVRSHEGLGADNRDGLED
jgi:ATP-dependent DNA ligase